MDLLSTNAVRVSISVFVVFFCGGLVCRVESQRIVKVANLGDDITLSCYPPISNYRTFCLYKNGFSFAYRDGGNFHPQNSRITQHFLPYHSESKSQYSLSFTDVNYGDSAIYQCYHGHGACSEPDENYDLRVIGCSCIVTDNQNPESRKVVCELLNYVSPTSPLGIRNIWIKLNKNEQVRAAIDGNDFSFSISRSMLNSNLKVEINPYDNVMANIVCTVPAQLTSPQPSTHYTTLPTPTTRDRRSAVSSTVSPPASPPASPTASPPASPTVSPPASEESTAGEATKYHTPPNEISSQDSDTRNGNVTLIIAIIGSLFILILIVVIVILRYKQTKSRQQNKHNGNASTKKEHPPEVCYESVEDGSRKGPEYTKSIGKVRNSSKDEESVADNGGLVDNILYDSSDRITENSISRVEGLLDNALYAMPDKRATINRESTSNVVDRPSDSDILYGNSDIISQHEKSKDTLQRGDQYENVEMPGSGNDAEEIALYAMPDKGPKRNTLKTTPKPEKTSSLSKNEVVDVDALYAEVDKPKKK